MGGAIPPFTAAISLTVYTLAVEGNEMDASTLFAAITAFNQLRFPLLFYPMFFAQYVQAKVSLQRLADFLMMSEVDETGGTQKVNEMASDLAISLSNLSVAWGSKPGTEGEQQPGKDEAQNDELPAETLSDINLSVS